jgi:predicted O-methyltransferase YrrM
MNLLHRKSYVTLAFNESGLDDAQRKRLRFAASYFQERIDLINRWVTTSREPANFTYDLGRSNKLNLASMVALVTGVRYELAKAYVDEIDNDAELKAAILSRAASENFMDLHDHTALFGRRIGWYAVARILKPKVIVETGVDKGLGAMVLCSALRRNDAEGSSGLYYGTDLMPGAGYLLCEPYAKYGKVLYGDSIQTLSKFPDQIDLFINDSDHTPGYELREYETIAPILSERAIVLSDNGAANIFDWSQRVGRRFVYFDEKPLDHWYPGGGIGFSFKEEGTGISP